MTTNAQGLTFGEWLAKAEISPDRFGKLTSLAHQVLHDEWECGVAPYPGIGIIGVYERMTSSKALGADSLGITDPGLAGDRLYTRSKP